MAITCVIQYDIQYAYTEVFAPGASRRWLKRGRIICKEGESVTNLAAVRRVKKELGLSGIRCKTDDYGEFIVIRPAGQWPVVFISIHYTDNGNKKCAH